MRQIFTMALLFLTTASFSQQDASHWKRKGNLNLLFNQFTFNKNGWEVVSRTLQEP